MSLTFPSPHQHHPPPQGSLLSQLTDICQWRNITTIADVEMLIPSPLSPRLPPLQVCGTSLLVLSAAGSCFCPLKGPGADCTAAESARPLQWITNHCSKSTLMCKANYESGFSCIRNLILYGGCRLPKTLWRQRGSVNIAK